MKWRFSLRNSPPRSDTECREMNCTLVIFIYLFTSRCTMYEEVTFYLEPYYLISEFLEGSIEIFPPFLWQAFLSPPPPPPLPRLVNL
jgi:hypothetical protein